MSEVEKEVSRLSVVSRYVRRVGNELGVRDWQLIVMEGGESSDRLADIACVPGRRLAHVRVFESFYAASAADQRYAIVHELTHCHFNAILDHIDILRPSVGSITFEPFFVAHQRRLEEGVDGIAAAIAERFELPPTFD